MSSVGVRGGGSPCFGEGTLIRTARGEVAVEDLQVGDFAVTLSGKTRPIIWIGHRRVEKPGIDQLPVHIRKDAFGNGRPTRDLRLSSGHAVCLKVVDEVLMPVGELAFGATVAREMVEAITYWHVELDSHDVIFAEGMPVESYLDCGGRGWFSGEDGVPDPDRSNVSEARFGRPYMDDPAIFDGVRQRLNIRADGMGWKHTNDMEPHLLIDGVRIEPAIAGDMARFIFPADTREAILASRSFCPMLSSRATDERQLGVQLKGLRVSDGLTFERDYPPDHESLMDGYHPGEKVDEVVWRWTNGRAVLPGSLWEGCDGVVILRVNMQANAGWRWVEPASPEDVTPVEATPTEEPPAKPKKGAGRKSKS